MASLLKLCNFLVISRKHRNVRKTIIFLFTNLLIFAGLIFTFEIVLIYLGVDNIAVPLPIFTSDFLQELVF
jgi:hypothetical protein